MLPAWCPQKLAKENKENEFRCWVCSPSRGTCAGFVDRARGPWASRRELLVTESRCRDPTFRRGLTGLQRENRKGIRYGLAS